MTKIKDRVEIFLYDPNVNICTSYCNVVAKDIPKWFITEYIKYLAREEEHTREKKKITKIVDNIKESLKNDGCVNRLWIDHLFKDHRKKPLEVVNCYFWYIFDYNKDNKYLNVEMHNIFIKCHYSGVVRPGEFFEIDEWIEYPYFPPIKYTTHDSPEILSHVDKFKS